jgi:hypothetical protein
MDKLLNLEFRPKKEKITTPISCFILHSIGVNIAAKAKD